MPRIETKTSDFTPRKFKKRRAWLIDPLEEKQNNETLQETPKPKTSTKKGSSPSPLKEKSRKETNQEYNKSVTRVEQECNKTVTRVEQKPGKTKETTSLNYPDKSSGYSDSLKKNRQDCNKTVTRVEQDCNKTVTNLQNKTRETVRVLTHAKSKDETQTELLFSFLNQKKFSISNFEPGNPDYIILTLSGTQRAIFWHVALECIKRNTPSTGPIEIKGFFEVSGISIGVVRTTLNRLTSKGVLKRDKGKLGRNGFAIISMPSILFQSAKNFFQDHQNYK